MRVAFAHPDQVQHAIRCDIGQPDEGIGDLEQRVINNRGREREFFRVQRGQGFRRGFGENQHNQRQ